MRGLSRAERAHLKAGLRSSEAFVLRRCQALLASARGLKAREIAQVVGCCDQTVRNIIHAFNEQGLASLQRRSSRPHTIHWVIDERATQQLVEMVHHSPRDFGKPTSLWTLALIAETAFEREIIPRPVSSEAIRLALKRLGIRWRRAKRWINSPDPKYGQTRTGQCL